ncbi:hypothetical protein J1N35_010270 [Gossypium stocksii]|uniref:Uncharacterized protein n=1 Tax=Gossypium stocksii TaxID=47602 RepID=A0A9D3W0T5_9ROSI|nr:hypothetical protein J1N35_010270 [Gossypium stocksii]
MVIPKGQVQYSDFKGLQEELNKVVHKIIMKVEFAKEHLTKIVHAYFASKTVDPKIYDQKKKLEVELGRISTMLELHDKCQSEAIFFNDKSLNAGLFS